MGGTRVFPVQYGMILLQHGLAEVRLSNHPKLGHEPDDHDERYLACDELAAAPRLSAALSKSAITYVDETTSCKATVGKFAACSWFMQSPSFPARLRAAELFARGEKFLAVHIDQEGCRFARWAAFDASVSFTRPTTASPDRASIALRDLPMIPGYAALQSQYVDFRKRLNQPAKSRARPAGAGASLPAEWANLNGPTNFWTISAGSGSPELLIGFFRRAFSSDGPSPDVGAPEFCTSLVAVWSIAVDKLRFLGPTEPIVHGCSDFGVGGLIKSRPGIPLILYETTGAIGGLRFDTDRFVGDLDLTYRFTR